MWGLQPSEFWAMSPREWWLVFDAKMAKNKAEIDALKPTAKFSQDEREEMYRMNKEASNG